MPKQATKIKLSSLNGSRPSATKNQPVAAPGSTAKTVRSSLLPGGPMLWCLVGLAIGLTVWLGGRTYLKRMLADQLASASTEDVAIQSIDALLRLDGNATIEVSRGLAHPEFMVANAAFRALDGQLDAWTKLEPADRLLRMQKVVAELERIPADIDQDHRILVNGLASRIYADTLSNREIGAGNVLEACRRILAINDQRQSLTTRVAQLDRTLADPASPPPPLPTVSEPANPVPPPLAPGNSMNRIGSQPPDSPDVKDSKTDDQSRSTTTRSNRSMTRISLSDEPSVAESTAKPLHLSAGPPELPSSTARVSSGSSSMPTMTGRSYSDGLSQSDSSRSRVIPQNIEPLPAAASDSQPTITLSGIESLQIDQLVRLLSSVQPRVSQAATLALRQRGMPEENLEMAIQLATGSTEVRQTILGQIAQRDDMDVRPWLLWMAAEGEEPVRQQAVSLLKPIAADDMDVRRQLRLLLNKERDEQVAQTIRQVLVK